MRRRASLTVQGVVAGVVTFTAVACALMAVSLVRAALDGWRVGAWRDPPRAALAALEWGARLLFLLGFVSLARTYSRLWNAYAEAAPHGLPLPPRVARVRRCATALVVCTSVAVAGLVVGAYAANPHEFWGATTIR